MYERQVKLLNRLLDGFEGKLTSSKWAAIARCSPDTADATILNARNCRLRNTGKLGQLILAQLLQLANDANGLTDRHLDATLGRTKIAHDRFL